LKLKKHKHLKGKQHKHRNNFFSERIFEEWNSLPEEVVTAPSVNRPEKVLADKFHLDAWRETPKDAIVMDLFYYTLQFAREMKFNREKTSAFFSIIKKTHEVAVETPFGNLEQTFRYFKELILCHAVSRPPHSIELFNVDEVRKLTEYAINTYFRHFKMYKYAFTPLVRLDLSVNYVGVQVASPTPTEVAEAEEETVKETEAGIDGEEQGTETPMPEEEESDARKELRAMINTYLLEEIKKVKVTVDEQLKTTEDTLSKKIDAAEAKKSPRKESAKKKK